MDHFKHVLPKVFDVKIDDLYITVDWKIKCGNGNVDLSDNNQWI